VVPSKNLLRRERCIRVRPSQALQMAAVCLAPLALLVGICNSPLAAQSQPEVSAPAIVEVPAKQPSTSAPPVPNAGSITGTVVDKDGAVIANAAVVLTSGVFTAKVQSAGDGSFVFTSVPPGPFELSFSAPGFASQRQSGILPPGENSSTPPIQLAVATSVEINVTQTREEIAEQQIHEEEKQRVFGIVPNFYVSYRQDAVPLNTRQKFQLGWKSTLDPVSFGIAGVIAGAEQATNAYSGYGQGAQGYGKRLGATYADFVSGTFIGSVILPSVLKQDPRYFYKGTGSWKSRFFYAVANAVICKGDNGHWQPNYSNMLGSLAAGGLSNLYYPASDRNGVGLTFENALIGIGGTAMGTVIEEFFIRKVTPHAADRQPSQN
jgi:carboxypeptidase family protein